MHAAVQTRKGQQAKFSFLLAEKTIGKKRGSLLTRQLLRYEQ